MKKIVFSLGVLLFSALGTTQAAGRAAEIVAGVSAAFRAMKSYSVDFEVTMGEHRMAGNYAVCGETYRIVLGDAEVWFDGKTRHEIDNRRKEVRRFSASATARRSCCSNPRATAECPQAVSRW